MRLLVITQAIDRDDPALGFFHEWVEALAPHFERIVVVCLKQGRHMLPSNVTVESLGKEKGTSRLTRTWRVFRYSFSYRKEYDAVFVHMNQEYVLLTGWFWRKLGKPIYFWRNHYAGSLLTDRAARQCKKVFYTSKSSYTARFPNAVQMPVGVDMKTFMQASDSVRDPRAILFFGRIASSKKPDVFLKALGLLARGGTHFGATVCGVPASKAYLENLEHLSAELGISSRVRFLPPLAHREVPKLMSKHAIYVNCSPSGMYDKTMFEAAACGCMTVACSKDFAALVPPRFSFADDHVEELARKLRALLELPLIEQQGASAQMHNLAKMHSLEMLAVRLAQEMH